MSLKFDPITASWSADNARACARLAALAYEQDQAKVTAALSGELGLRTYTPVDDRATETQSFVASNDQFVVVAFRGTEEKIADWMTDAHCARVPFNVGQVHRGFHRAFESVWESLRSEIDRQQTGRQTLWFTGHSLGGALATLAVARMRSEAPPKPVQRLYTFGSPRVGDWDFRQAFDSDFSARTFRYVNEDDLVPHLAPEALGYTHVGHLMWFEATGKLNKDMAALDRLLEARKLELAALLAGTVPPLENHRISNYLTKASTKAGQTLG